MRALLFRQAVFGVVVALSLAVGAAAHPTGQHAGFVATVSTISPPVPGLLVQVVGGHERLAVRNWTLKKIVVFGPQGHPALRLAPGEHGSVYDPQIRVTGPVPDREKLIRNWEIRGEAGGKPFVIRGFLGYRPPPGATAGATDDGVPAWAIALAAVAGGAVLLGGAAALALPLRRREGKGKPREAATE